MAYDGENYKSAPPPSYESLSQYGQAEEGWPGPGIPMEPVYNAPTPYNTRLSGGLREGQIIYICGIPRAGAAQRFNVNFCVDSVSGDMAFHFDVRFQHSDGYNLALVRNTRENGTWGREERDKPCFPFQPDMFFEMMILVESKCFKVAVNNQHLVEYNHRILPLSSVNYLNIDGDVRLCHIKMQ